MPHPSWPFTSFAALCAFARNAQSSPWPPEPAKHLEYHTNPIRCRGLSSTRKKSAQISEISGYKLASNPPFERSPAMAVQYRAGPHKNSSRTSHLRSRTPLAPQRKRPNPCCKMLQDVAGIAWNDARSSPIPTWRKGPAHRPKGLRQRPLRHPRPSVRLKPREEESPITAREEKHLESNQSISSSRGKEDTNRGVQGNQRDTLSSGSQNVSRRIGLTSGTPSVRRFNS